MYLLIAIAVPSSGCVEGVISGEGPLAGADGGEQSSDVSTDTPDSADAGLGIDISDANDADVPDADEPDDGGQTDAEPDGGQPDADEPDAGELDANIPDANAPDANAPDADLPDAFFDAGVPDADLPDAGPGDGGVFPPVDMPDQRTEMLPNVLPLSEADIAPIAEACHQPPYYIPDPNEEPRYTFYGFPDEFLPAEPLYRTYGYWVHVPENYDPTKPAGLVLYFHGLFFPEPECVYAGPNFQGFLDEPGGPNLASENLIWIMPSFPGYQDGYDFVGAMKYAIAKAFSTYKIIPGWGMIGGFSYGGKMTSYFVADTGGWPFNQVATESGLVQRPFGENLEPMGMVFSLGQREMPWFDNITSYTIDRVQEARSITQNLDVVFEVIRDGDHEPDVVLSTLDYSIEGYFRSKLFFAPFIYAPDFSEDELTEVINSSQALSMGNARLHAEQVLMTSSDTSIRDKASVLLNEIEDRVTRMIDMLKLLAVTDPVLADYYAGVAEAQLQLHPRQGEVRTLREAVRSAPDFELQRQLTLDWYANLQNAYQPGGEECGNFSEMYIDAAQDLIDELPSTSLGSRMASQALELRPRMASQALELRMTSVCN